MRRLEQLGTRSPKWLRASTVETELVMTKRRDKRDMLTAKKIAKQERFLTVTICPETNAHVPWIRLRGLWLQQAGFTPQSRIRVRVMTGCLVITKE